MIEQLLTRNSHYRKQSTNVPFLGELSLAAGRSHEFCGTARRTLAMMLAGRLEGPVMWILPNWEIDRLTPQGMLPFANPGRFTFITPSATEDLQWTMEEVLHSGAVPLVICEMQSPPALTPVRRMHLAAENGAKTGMYNPIGLILTQGDGSAQGVETRFHMASAFVPDGVSWSLTRRRARTEPVKTWQVTPQKTGFTLTAKPT